MEVRFKCVFHSGYSEHGFCLGRILIDSGLSKGHLSEWIFLFISLAKCLFRLHFVHYLWYAGYCPSWWELAENLRELMWELMWECWLRALFVVLIGFSLRVCSEPMFTFYEQNDHFWSFTSSLIYFFLSSAAWPAWIACLIIKSGSLSRHSLRRKTDN